MLNVRESGQGLAEYALILSLIAIAAVMALIFLSGTIQSVLSIIGSQL
jgi:pilus assembly protein Flp/PilA